ncbi:unnamed protein product [Vicia faba]|uniref:Uncharacterized protein n=1 Tax=Vicia faba TaxID=3906 RepID=A0AAV0Z314_VICFA|nr:unnamed protein product [Vicia faba]
MSNGVTSSQLKTATFSLALLLFLHRPSPPICWRVGSRLKSNLLIRPEILRPLLLTTGNTSFVESELPSCILLVFSSTSHPCSFNVFCSLFIIHRVALGAQHYFGVLSLETMQEFHQILVTFGVGHPHLVLSVLRDHLFATTHVNFFGGIDHVDFDVEIFSNLHILNLFAKEKVIRSNSISNRSASSSHHESICSSHSSVSTPRIFVSYRFRRASLRLQHQPFADSSSIHSTHSAAAAKRTPPFQLSASISTSVSSSSFDRHLIDSIAQRFNLRCFRSWILLRFGFVSSQISYPFINIDENSA